VLTAAHCIYAFQNEYNWAIEVHVGRYNITAPLSQDTIYAAKYGISNAIVHNGYNSENNNNDIGLIKTSSYIKFK
jgi:secreted trypsin-like serine protease